MHRALTGALVALATALVAASDYNADYALNGAAYGSEEGAVDDLYKRLDGYFDDRYPEDALQEGPPMIASRIPMETNLRDQEYLKHAPNIADQNPVAPEHDAQENAVKQEKPESLPFYCHPPNPCPKGKTEGCSTDIPDSADVQRKYIKGMQDRKICACDEEHMFHCSGKQSSIDMQKGHNMRDDLDDILDSLMNDDSYKYKVSGNKREYIVAKKSPTVKKRDAAEDMFNPRYQTAHRVEKKSRQV